jgi:hypothetical protein
MFVTDSANNSPNTQDLFTRQKQTWASIPPRIQETFLRNIRDKIKARVEQAHGVQEERVHAYDDDWEAVAAELESRVSNQTSAQPVPRRNERHNLALETNWECGNQSQETDTSFNYSQSSIALDTWEARVRSCESRFRRAGSRTHAEQPDEPFSFPLPLSRP